MVEMERWDETVARRTRQQTRTLRGGVSGRGKRRSVVREAVAGEGEKDGDLSRSRGTSTVGCRTRAQFARLRCSVAEGGDDRDIALERCTGKKIGMMRCGGRKRKSRSDSEVLLLGTGTGGVNDCNVEGDFSVDKKVTDEVEEEAGVMPATDAPTCVARRTRSQFQKLTSGIMKAGGNEPGGFILIDDSDDNSNGMEKEKDEEDIMEDGEDVDNSIFAGNRKDKRDENDLGQNSSVGGEAFGSLRNMPVAMLMHTPQQIRILCDKLSGKRRKLENGSTMDDSTSNREIGEVEVKNRDSSDSLQPSCVAHRTRSQFAKSKCGGTKAGDNSSENVIQIDDEDGEGNAAEEEEDDDMANMIKGDKVKKDSADRESREDESKDDDSSKHMSVNGVHSKDSEEELLMCCSEKENDDLEYNDVVEKFEYSVGRDEMASISVEKGKKGKTVVRGIVDFENVYEVRKMPSGIKRTRSSVGRRTRAQFARLRRSVAEGGDDRDIALERCTGKKIGMMRCGGRKRKSRSDSEVLLLGTGTGGVSDCNVEDDFSVDKKVTDEVEEEAGVVPATGAPTCVARRTRSQFQKLTSGIMKAGGNEPGGFILIDDSDDNSDGVEEEKDEEDIMEDGEDVDNSIFAGNGKDKRDEDDLGQNSSVGGEAVGSLRNMPVAMPMHTPQQIRILCDEVSGKRTTWVDDSAMDDSTSNRKIGEVEEKNRDSSDSLQPSCVAHRTRSQFAKSKCGGTKAGENSSENVIQIDDEDGEGNAEEEEEDDDMGDMIKGDKVKKDSAVGESREDESKDDDSNKHMSVDDVHNKDSAEELLMSCSEKENDDLENNDAVEKFEYSVGRDEMASISVEKGKKGKTVVRGIVDFENVYEVRKMPSGIKRTRSSVGRQTRAQFARLRRSVAEGGDDRDIALEWCTGKKIGMMCCGGRKRKSRSDSEVLLLGTGTEGVTDCNVEDDFSVDKKVTDEVEEEAGVMPATGAPTCVARRTRSQFQKLTSGIMKAGGNEPGGFILIDDSDDNSDGVEEEKDEEDIMKDGEDVDNSIVAGNGKDKRVEDDLGQNSFVGGEAVGSLRNMPVAMPMHTPHQMRILCDEVSGKRRKWVDDSAMDDSTCNRKIGEVEVKNRDSSDSLQPSCVAHRTRSQFAKSKCGGTKAADNSSENVIQIDDEDGEGNAEEEEEDDDMVDMIKCDKVKEDFVDRESTEDESKDDDSNKHMSVDDVHNKDSEGQLLMSCSEKENDDLGNKDVVENFENSVCRDEMASISVEKGKKVKTGVQDIVDFENVYEVRKMPSGIKRTRSNVDFSSCPRVSQPPMCEACPMKKHNIKRGSDFTEAENNKLDDSIQIVDNGDSCDNDDEEVEMEKEEDDEKEDMVKGCNVMNDSIEEDNIEDDLIDHSVDGESSGGDEYDEEDLMDDSVEESSEVEYDEDDLMEHKPVDGKGGDDSELLLFSTDEENDDLSSDMENEFSVDASADILRGHMPACIARRTRSHFQTRSDILRDGTFSNPCCLVSDEDDQNIALLDNNISGMHKDLLGGKCRSFEFNKRKLTFASEGGDECSDEDDQNIALHDNNSSGMHKDLLVGKRRSFEFNKRKLTFASEGGDECSDEDDQNIALCDNNSSGMHKDLLVDKRRSFEFSKRELASASEGGVDCMQIPKSLGEEGRPPDRRHIKHPNDPRKIQPADSAHENRDECRQKSDGQGRYDVTPFKRKHIRQAYDARKVLLEAIWGHRDSLQDSIGIVIPKVARITNWKFTFDEESQPVKKSEAELEFDKLWMEFEFCLRSCEIESGYADMVENGDLLQPRLDPCIWGSHDAILDEEIGFKCRHCSIILQEIRDVVAPFELLPSLVWHSHKGRCLFTILNRNSFRRWFGTAIRDIVYSLYRQDSIRNRKDPVERYVTRDFERLDDDFFRNLPTENITNDLNDGFPSALDGTVWDLIPGIKCTLYPHQREGFEFIWKNVAGTVNLSEARRLKESNDGSGCIISHAPGTGKSRLTIVFLQAYLRFFPDCRPVIIAPKSMLLTWEDEFKKWNVDFPFHNVNNNEISGKEDAEALAVLARLKYGSPRKEILRMVKLYSWKCQSSILGISYTLFEKLTFGRASEEDDQSEGNVLLKLPGILVLDEGHTPRNNDTLIWQALSSVRTQKRICLSGTPFQNNFDELFNTFCMARPGFTSTMSDWNKGNDIKRRGHKPNAVKANWANLTNSICENNVEELKNLKAMISPFVHVYTGNVLQDTLPGLSHKIIYLRPGSLQKSLLQSADGIVNIMERRHIASLISVHPSLLLQHSSFVTGESFPELRELKGMQLTPQDGIKTKFLIDFLRLTVALKEKVLVFSDYIDPLIFLKDQLKSYFSWTEGKEILYMDGKLDLKQRQASIIVFNEEGSDVKVLLASKKACCEGISLVGASRVVFLDAAWNPSVQRQAISRAYRLGQKKFVYVYHLITFETIEEDVHRLQMRKDRISNMVFPSAKGTDVNSHWNSSEGPEDKILLEMLGHSTITNLIEKVV